MTKTAYVVLGITMDGRKDILGVWMIAHESSKFWLNVLNALKGRGVQDVYLFCTDGLCGMLQAIEAVYPQSRLQRRIVHQICNSTRYVSYKDIRPLIADLERSSIRLSAWRKRSAGENNTPLHDEYYRRINRQFRQITKNTPSFTNDDSLRRMLHLASQRIIKHWHARCQDWDMALIQLEIMFADRAG